MARNPADAVDEAMAREGTQETQDMPLSPLSYPICDDASSLMHVVHTPVAYVHMILHISA